MTIDRFAQPRTPCAGPLPRPVATTRPRDAARSDPASTDPASTDPASTDPAGALHALLDVQTLADDLTFHLPPERLRADLGALIRRYVVARSATLAESIIRHLQALYLHPALRDAPEQAQYRQVAQHWRLLVAQHHPA